MSWDPMETISGIKQSCHQKKMSSPNFETVKSGCVRKPVLSARSLTACQNKCAGACACVVCPKKNFKLKVETSDTLDGPAIDGPVTIRSGDTLRLWSEGGLQMSVVEGSALVGIEPANILMTSGGAPIDPPKDQTRPMIYVDPEDGSIYVWNPESSEYNNPITPSSGETGGDGSIYGLSAVVTTEICDGEDNLALAPDENMSSNASISLGPRGAGFISTRCPDDSPYGGICRGQGAVDFQIGREDSEQVALGDFSVISGGYANRCDQNISVICGGAGNVILANVGYGPSFSSAIVAGNGNVNTSMLSFIGGGYHNQLHGTGFSVLGSIVNGVYNQILDGTYCSTILNGDGNVMTRSMLSLIGSGEDNTITDGRRATIINGLNNSIIGGTASLIGSGRNNNINTSSFGLICHGTGNVIDGLGGHNSIISGTNNQIHTTSHSCIVSGYNHTINHSLNTIIGGTGISTTGVDQVHLGTTTKIHKVARDNNAENFMVWNSISKEVKYMPILRGFAELVSGSVLVTIPNPPGIDNNTVIVATHRFPGPPLGILYVSAVSLNSFTIYSTNPSDTNTWVNWIAILDHFDADT